MTREVLIGVDVGTTSCKAAVVSLDGAELAHASRPTPWVRVPTGAEIDPHALAAAAIGAAEDALAQAATARPVAFGVCSMAETGVLLDAAGDPACTSIAWHDDRGRDEADAVAANLGAARFTAHTGLPPSPLMSLAKIRWLRANDPGAARGVRWLNVSEWVVRSLGGDEAAELSLASRTGFLDVDAGAWWDEALAAGGVTASFFPDPTPAATPLGRAATGPLEGAVLAVGGHDHLCAAVGAGATRPGDLFDSCGTAEALVAAVEPPVSADRVARAVAGGVTVGRHVYGGLRALLGGFRSGLALQGFLDEHDLDEEERAAPTGAWRAALAAIEEQAAAIAATIDEVAGPRRRLVVAGGWSHDAGVAAVKEERLGPFERPPVWEAGARGAALLAGVAAGVYAGIDALPELEVVR